MKNIFLLLFLLPSVVFASGRIKGFVTDSVMNEALVGANIILVNTSLGSATNVEGEYSISAIPAGKYIARCSFIGYQSKEVAVTVVDDQTSTINFSLFAKTIQGEEVIVTAQLQGQMAAINQQVNSDVIMNVISEQKIKELPDANAAEAIGRLPGVSVTRSGGEASKIVLRGLGENMSTITIDGVKISPTDVDSRGVDLSAIAQGSLSGIELSKAITADMDGEAIAGNVNFVTRVAPDKRELQVDTYGMYGAMDKTYDQYNFIGRYGERFFDDVLGVQVFGNLERRNRSNEQYNLSYDQSNTWNDGPLFQDSSNTALRLKYPISNFVVMYAPEMRTRKGGKIILDFKTPDEGILKLSAEYNKTERRLSAIQRNYSPLNSGVSYYFRGQDIDADIKNFAFQGKNHLGNWDVDWSLSFSQSTSETPYDYEVNVIDPNGMANASITQSLWYTDQYEQLIPYATNDFMKAYLQNATAHTASSLDFEKTVFMNIKRSYDIFGVNGEFKFGGKYRSKYHRRNSTLEYSSYQNGTNFFKYVLNPDGSIGPKDFARYGFTNIVYTGGNLIALPNFTSSSTRNIYGKYLLDPMYNTNWMRNFYEMNIMGIDSNTSQLEYTDDASVKGTNYGLTENVTSGYLMNTFNFGTVVTLITGVRFEKDVDDYHALYTRSFASRYPALTDSTATHTESIVLPNMHLIVRPTDFMNVRAAAYRGINRPDFNYRLPTYYCSKGITDDSRTLLIQHNSNLLNADAWNYETNVQFYGDQIGLLSISAYYKKINNMVSYLNTTQIVNAQIADSIGVRLIPGTTLANTYVSLPYNSQDPTRVWGFEIEHQTNFHYLPGLLSHIVLSYNLTISRTETYTTESNIITTYVIDPIFGIPLPQNTQVLNERKSKIPNAPELFGNVSFGCDFGGFSGRLSYFYQRHYYTDLSSNNRSNYIQKSFDRLDLSLKEEITNYLSIGINVNNITNSGEGRILSDDLQGWQKEVSDYKFGTSAEMWLKVTI